MKTFLKAQTASFLATVADFIVTALCHELLKINVVASAAIGNVGGAAVNFMLGRNWAFDSAQKQIDGSSVLDGSDQIEQKRKSVFGQAFRYGLVWCGYFVLATLGIYLLETFTPLHYILSKALIGIFLAVTYNYYLQKKFVFN